MGGRVSDSYLRVVDERHFSRAHWGGEDRGAKREGAFGGQHGDEAFSNQGLPQVSHDLRMDEPEEHICPRIARNGAPAVGNDWRYAVDGEPVRSVAGLHEGNCRGVNACQQICGRAVHRAGDVLKRRLRELAGLEGP
eukprot:5196232-Alexandrium_andersonii.AAC.1